MPVTRLDQALLQKLVTKTGKSPQYLRERVSRRANREGISSSAALIVWAREMGIGTGQALQRLSPELRQEVQRAPRSPIPPAEFREEATARGPRRTVPKAKASPSRRGRKTVFVVHGRDVKIRRALFQFLRSIGLHPVEWGEALKLAGKPSPYIGEVLDAAFERASAVVVLLTPDDEAKLRRRLLKKDDPPFERLLSGQPRPNVLFEAGLAFGRHPNRTLLIKVGKIRPISDIEGLHIHRLSNAPESRQELVSKLKSAGCSVDVVGSDWLSEGDFGR